MTATDIDLKAGIPMRVFVTGASGWIGSGVVPELIGAGHQVTGLARSDSSAAALTAAGAEVQRGTLDDLDILRSAAAASDGVIHLAFKHDIAFTGGFQEAADVDRRAVETFGEALAGSGRPFVLASGTGALAPGRVAAKATGTILLGPLSAAVRRLGRPLPSWSGPSLPAASARQSCDSLRRITAKEITASWLRWWAPPTTRASPVTSATGPTAGLPCTARFLPPLLLGS
jgi:hypothetical protein